MNGFCSAMRAGFAGGACGARCLEVFLLLAGAALASLIPGPSHGASGDPRVRLIDPERGERRFVAPATIFIKAQATAAKGRTITRVEFFADGQPIGLAASAPYVMNWLNVPVGNYQVRARAFDNLGGTDWSPAIRLRVNENREPSVRLIEPVGNASYALPSTVQIEARARDRDHNLVLVEFYANGALIGQAASEPWRLAWTPATAGQYVLEAKAIDALGASAMSRQVTVQVSGNQAPQVSVTAPSSGTVFTAPATISISASAHDPDNDLARVEFYAGATLIGAATGSPYMIEWSNVTAGQYSLVARAIDAQGAQADSAPVTVVVNSLPVVSITSPANNASFTAPATITVEASAVDSGGTISKVDFFVNGSLAGTAVAPPYGVTVAGLGQGSYALAAVATDNLGGVSDPFSVAVSVTNAAAQIYFIHTDHLNTPRVIANQMGQTVWRWSNDDPFGANAPDENPSGLGNFTCNLRLPGQYFDKATNLHYNYFRDYDSAIGRYVQSDPIGLAGGINTYAYVGGDPLGLSDPTGLAVWLCLRNMKPLLPIANHAYFYDDKTGKCCGSMSPSAICKERGPKGDHCFLISSNDSDAEKLIGCCNRKVDPRSPNKEFYFPFINDCQNVGEDCIHEIGMAPPASAHNNRWTGCSSCWRPTR